MRLPGVAARKRFVLGLLGHELAQSPSHEHGVKSLSAPDLWAGRTSGPQEFFFFFLSLRGGCTIKPATASS